MILKAILCVQHFCSFVAMLFIVDLLIKTDSTVICVPSAILFKKLQIWKISYFNWFKFVYYLKFTPLKADFLSSQKPLAAS